MNGGDKGKMDDIFSLLNLSCSTNKAHIYSSIYRFGWPVLYTKRKRKHWANWEWVQKSFVAWSVTKMSGIQCPRLLSIVQSEKWIEDEICIVWGWFLCFHTLYVIRKYIFTNILNDVYRSNRLKLYKCENETL